MSDLMTQQSQERGERILEATRELLAERGYGQVTVRELAKRCGVSVPTLYNRFGGKDALIARAVQARFSFVLSSVEEESEPSGHARLMALVGRMADEAVELADYNRALLRAFSQVRETGVIHESLAQGLSAAVAEQLGEMRVRRQLAEWVAIDLLAAQVATACIAATMTWSAGVVTDRGLRPFMEHSVGMLLAASARGATQKALLDRVRAAQEIVAAEFPTTARRGSDVRSA